VVSQPNQLQCQMLPPFMDEAVSLGIGKTRLYSVLYRQTFEYEQSESPMAGLST
jgi:hypothetical protein